MQWFVHRNPIDDTIASLSPSNTPGYDDEQLAGDAPEVVAFLAAAHMTAPGPSPREWLERLTPEKQAAIAAAGLSNAQTYLWLMKAMGSSSIDVTLPETIAGVDAFVAAGVLTADDQAVLLAP